MSKTLIAILISGIVAVGVSATFLFPVVQNINSVFSSEESPDSKNEVLNEAEASVSNQSMTTTTSETIDDYNKDNPSVKLNDQNNSSVGEEVATHEYLKSDTIKSNYLIDDIPQSRR